MSMLLMATACDAADENTETKAKSPPIKRAVVPKTPIAGGPIIHDAEYAILAAQNGETWIADDKAIEEKLASIRENNGGKPPNFIYILLDDVGR